MCPLSLPPLPFCSGLLPACPQFSLFPVTVPLNSKLHSKDGHNVSFKIHCAPYTRDQQTHSLEFTVLIPPTTYHALSPPSSDSSSFVSGRLLPPKSLNLSRCVWEKLLKRCSQIPRICRRLLSFLTPSRLRLMGNVSGLVLSSY